MFCRISDVNPSDKLALAESAIISLQRTSAIHVVCFACYANFFSIFMQNQHRRAIKPRTMNETVMKKDEDRSLLSSVCTVDRKRLS